MLESSSISGPDIHQRRIIAEGLEWNLGGGIEETQMFSYCVACEWYEAGDHEEIADAWTSHMKEIYEKYSDV
jgi:hypothetical protein